MGWDGGQGQENILLMQSFLGYPQQPTQRAVIKVWALHKTEEKSNPKGCPGKAGS